MDSFITDLSVLFLVIGVVSFAVKLLRQPIILGYIISGMIFSLISLENSSISEYVLVFSELGITFLLFLMGLEFDFKNYKEIGKDIIITTIAQSLIFGILSFTISFILGFQFLESAYLAILFMFSSTLLVAKWIENKKDGRTLYGKVVLGTLVIQDILAISAFTLLNISSSSGLQGILFLPLGGIFLLIIAYLSTKYFLNPIIKFTMKYPELLFIFSISVCFFFVKISTLLGYTSTIGAFIGGLVLANTIYKNDIRSRLKSLVIFFTLLFFVGLGFQLNFNIAPRLILFTVGLSVVCFMIKPLAIYLTLRLRGYDAKTSLKVGLNLAQFSEFGIIIVLTGISTNAISPEIGTITILSVVLTIIFSSYIIKYDDAITNVLYKYLKRFDYLFPVKEETSPELDIEDYTILYFGYNEFGKDIFLKLQALGKILVIENDPININILKKEGIPYLYNSVSNVYFFEHLHFETVQFVISNQVELEDNLMILKKLKEENSKAHMIVSAKSLKDSLALYEAGADYVLYSKEVNEHHLSVLIEDYSKDINTLIEKKIKDMKKLKLVQNTKEEADDYQFLSWDKFMKRLNLKK